MTGGGGALAGTAGTKSSPVRIDFVFDAVCPWCFIGKRRLEHALRLRPGLAVEVRWRPFLLNPDIPPHGVDRTAYLVRKFGSENRVRRLFGAIVDAGQSVEIDFALDRIRRTPNTVNAHRLVRFAATQGRAGDMVEALFLNYFINGKDIGDLDILASIARHLGLNEGEVASYLRSGSKVEEVYRDNNEAHRLGLNGVPSFVFNGVIAISGAQDPRILARILDVGRVLASAPKKT